ncbi:MAG: bifunctional precorrin-2 dehydrogenase/sirohydrochlorin ferrochelatase [Magnetococcales bacterium]|nr:bifunctional precorrin-2 dehydrogenase/sirohydrochlorin ferrochelatase [Magnetococcales bacterium]
MTIPGKEVIPGLPLFLDLRHRACLVLGGEGEAVTKVEALLLAGAHVLLLAQRIAPELAARAEEGQLHWSQERFCPQHLDGIWFILSTLNDPVLNETVMAEAQRRQIFMNVVDQRPYCSALWPAVIRRDPVMVAFSTGGTSPALAGYLRRQIAGSLPREMGTLATWLGGWRKQVANLFPNLEERGCFWQKLLAGGVVNRFIEGDVSGAEEMIHQELHRAAPIGVDREKKPERPC